MARGLCNESTTDPLQASDKQEAIEDYYLLLEQTPNNGH